MTHSILLIDDDAEIRSALKDFLQDEGYRIVAVGGIEEGVEVLGNEPMDLVLSDAFARSGESAVASLAPLRRAAANVPIGVLSGWNIHQRDMAGLAFVLRKPPSLDELLVCIQ